MPQGIAGHTTKAPALTAAMEMTSLAVVFTVPQQKTAAVATADNPKDRTDVVLITLELQHAILIDLATLPQLAEIQHRQAVQRIGNPQRRFVLNACIEIVVAARRAPVVPATDFIRSRHRARRRDRRIHPDHRLSCRHFCHRGDRLHLDRSGLDTQVAPLLDVIGNQFASPALGQITTRQFRHRSAHTFIHRYASTFKRCIHVVRQQHIRADAQRVRAEQNVAVPERVRGRSRRVRVDQCQPACPVGRRSPEGQRPATCELQEPRPRKPGRPQYALGTVQHKLTATRLDRQRDGRGDPRIWHERSIVLPRPAIEHDLPRPRSARQLTAGTQRPRKQLNAPIAGR